MPKQRSTRNARKSTNPVQKNPSKKRNGRVATPVAVLEDKMRYSESAKLQIIAALPGILHGLIEKAKTGGYQQAKLLLDLCDAMDTDPSQSSHQHSQQLCDALLDGLRFSVIGSADLKSDRNIS